MKEFVGSASVESTVCGHGPLCVKCRTTFNNLKKCTLIQALNNNFHSPADVFFPSDVLLESFVCLSWCASLRISLKLCL